jgi:predicted Zn-dependent peptidase
MRRLAISGAAAVAVCWLSAAPVSAQAPNWPTERPPRPTAARDVKFPPYQVRTLKNGLQVIAVSHHEQPAVSLRLIVRAGGAQDPNEKPGVASFMASLLDQGTTTKSAEQIASTIDSIGGAIGSGSGTDLTFITGLVMKDSFDLALNLLSDIAQNPAFSPEEIERQRQQIFSGLQVSYDDPEYLAGVVFDRLVYGTHPYGKPDSGTPASIGSITRDDLVKFHKAWFGANNAILAVVGDVSAEEAFAGAERAFGSWAQSPQAALKPIDPPPPARRVVIVDRPGSAQTEIRVGNIAMPRKHPDYIALNLAMRILGGEGGNRLHRVLRSERGLTYGASAEVKAWKETGDVVAETDTRSETTSETLRLLVDEMTRIQRQRVQPRELADAQAYITGSFPLTIETPSAIAVQIIHAVVFGIDLQEMERFRDLVNAVTVDDIQRVSQKYLHPDRLSIVLVGDANVFAKQLPALGFDQVERISARELDLTSPDLRRRGAAPARRDENLEWGLVPAGHNAPLSAGRAMPAAPASKTLRLGSGQANASELVARVVSAKGGVEKLRAIRTIVSTADMTVESRLGRSTFPATTTIHYPDRFRTDAMTAVGRLVQVFNKGECWVQNAQGVRAASPPLAAELRARVQRDVVRVLLGLVDGRITATRIADIVENGRAMPALEVKQAEARAFTLVLDPDSSLIVRQRYATDGDPRIVEEAFSDYRDVDGVKVAFKTVVRASGLATVERVVRSFRYNVPIDSALFTRPS